MVYNRSITATVYLVLSILRKSLVTPELEPMSKARKCDNGVCVSGTLASLQWEFNTTNPLIHKSAETPFSLPNNSVTGISTIENS